jgi:ethanolamine utilization microcompartment shell protein EutS
LPKNIAADLDIQADRVNAGTLDNFSGTIDEDTVRGKLNGGGVNVSADAGSGRVSLTFQ